MMLFFTVHHAISTVGRVLHAAWFYDLVVWLSFSGKERAFRKQVLNLASVTPGETILDIGCGTGTLAILAKSKVGASGFVYGVDPSPEMIARFLAR